jgi:hypothetical protein
MVWPVPQLGALIAVQTISDLGALVLVAAAPYGGRRSSDCLSRLAGYEPVPAIYGPSGDVKWDEADPTYTVEAAKRGGS